jgi:hypothetical protein
MLKSIQLRLRRGFIPHFAILSILLTAAAVLAPVTPASAAAPADVSSSAECQIVIGKAAGPEHVSPVLSSQCAKPGERLAAPATTSALTLLMVWYTGYNYSGRSTKIYGDGGPCDSAGYGFAWVSSEWNDAIRAWKVFNYCYYSAAWEHINWGGFCKKYYGQVPNASAMDAEISSMWISRGSWAWTLCG